MLTSGIKFTGFKIKKKNFLLKKKLNQIIEENNHIIRSLGKNYKNNFNKNNLKKYKNFLNYRIIGMGGSTLGAQAIYDFLNHKINKG